MATQDRDASFQDRYTIPCLPSPINSTASPGEQSTQICCRSKCAQPQKDTLAARRDEINDIRDEKGDGFVVAGRRGMRSAHCGADTRVVEVRLK